MLELNREFLALNVHAVPPMRNVNPSSRGLGPIVACVTTELRRLDAALMMRSMRALNLRPDTVSA